jgi:hypothetical protein
MMRRESRPYFATAAALGFSRADWAALKLAAATYRAVSKAQAEGFDEKAANSGWIEAAIFAVYDLQSRALHLRPWETPPCFAGDRDTEAMKLVRRMRKARISLWHPDPLRALADSAAAGRKARSKNTAAEMPAA